MLIGSYFFFSINNQLFPFSSSSKAHVPSVVYNISRAGTCISICKKVDRSSKLTNHSLIWNGLLFTICISFHSFSNYLLSGTTAVILRAKLGLSRIPQFVRVIRRQGVFSISMACLRRWECGSPIGLVISCISSLLCSNIPFPFPFPFSYIHGMSLSFRRALNRTKCCTAASICIVRVDSNCIHRMVHAYFIISILNVSKDIPFLKSH